MVLAPLKGSSNSAPFTPVCAGTPFTVHAEATASVLVSKARTRMPRQVVSVVMLNEAGMAARIFMGCVVSITQPSMVRSTVISPIPGTAHAMVTQLLSAADPIVPPATVHVSVAPSTRSGQYSVVVCPEQPMPSPEMDGGATTGTTSMVSVAL